MTGKEYYACPTCKRAVATGTEKCQGCGQKLSWDNIRHENEAKGSKKAKIEFDVPADFALEDCRKCPLSYIGRNGDENVYECPLQMRGAAGWNYHNEISVRKEAYMASKFYAVKKR